MSWPGSIIHPNKTTQNGKIKVRVRFKTELFAFNVGMAINFGKLYMYIVENDLIYDFFAQKFINF